MKLHDLLIETAGRYGHRPAVVHGDRRISYARLHDHVCRLATRLQALGLNPGDRVGLLAENSIEYAVGYFAVSMAGLVLVPLDTSFRPPQLRHIIADSGAKVLITQTRFARHMAAVTADPTPLQLVIFDNPTVGLTLPIPSEAMIEMLGLADDAPGDPCGVDPAARDDLALWWGKLPEAERELAAIFYTSGSTGKPKGVMLSHRNLIANTVGTVEYLRLNCHESVIVILPFYYIYGNSLLLTHVAVGGRVVIDNRFTYPETVLDTMERERVTGFSGVPSNFMILLGNTTFAKRNLSDLRYFTQAGGAMAPEVIRRLVEAFPSKEIFIMYGQTEASPRVTWLPPEKLGAKLGSVGIPVPGVLVRVVDAEGREVGPDQEGEIIVGGDSVMMGYWQQKAEEEDVLHDGWLYTGDLARVDRDGFIFIVGRKKEIIKSGGNRVSAKEVEETILEVPQVAEVAVFGVPDPVLGEAIVAVVVPQVGALVEDRMVIDHCKARLAVHKVPKFVRFMAELPKYQSGKVIKQMLKETTAL